jgi:hypothetical protein
LSQGIKNGFTFIVISELHFFQIKRELFFGDAMVLNQSFFRITPESFHPINVNFARSKAFSMVYFEMPVPTKHQRVIALEFISINDGSPSDCLNGQVQQCFSADVLYNSNFYSAISVQNAKDRDFVGCATAPLAFPSATEIGLIEFNLPLEKVASAGVSRYNGHPDDVYGLQNRRITQSCLLGNLPGRQLQFKELDNPKPVLTGDSQAVDPPAGEVVKGISTAFTSESFTDDLVDVIAPASYAETMVVFPT